MRSKAEALAEYEVGAAGAGGHGDNKLNHSRSLVRASTAPAAGTSASPQGADEQQLRQIARLRARVSCMEEVINMYRAGIMALYPDGSSYGAAQFAGLGNTHGSLPHSAQVPNKPHSSQQQQQQQQQPTLADVLSNTWLPRELALVRRSFEEEIRLLDCEVLEMKGKLKQNVSYVAELRKRFEDNMKILYRCAATMPSLLSLY